MAKINASGGAQRSVPTPIWRKQNPLNSQGTAQQQNIKLTKGQVYRQLSLELTGAPTLTSGNNSAANTLLGDEWACVNNIQLQVNGSDVLRNFTGDDLWWMNAFWYKQPANVTAALGDAATANPAFDSTLLLPFWYPQSFHPFDTLVNSALYSDMTLFATFGLYTAINASATAWTANPQINVNSHEQILPADPADAPSLNWVVKKLSNIPGGANNSYRVLLDAGVSYSRFLINIKNAAGTADAGSTTFATTPQALVSNVKVVGTGGRVYEDRSYVELQQECRVRKGLPQAIVRRGQASNYGAWVEIDLCPDGRLGEAMPNPSDAYLEFNVLGNCQINVFPSIVFPRG